MTHGDMIRVDAHQHFWRYRAAEYPWIGEAMPVLRRDWLPDDLRPLLDARHLDACIAVQARSTEAETDFLLELAHEHDRIAAVVGWVDLRAGDLAARLARWHGERKLAGFRHPLQDEADVAAWLEDPAFARGIATLQNAGKVYEVLVHARQLGGVPAFCARHERHWLVLDHLGKPAIGGDGDAAWRGQLAELARLPHVLCKLSGLVTETGARPVVAGELHRYLDTALELFGPQRLMFGSDWPVCLLKAAYSDVAEIVATWSSRLGGDEQAALWGGTAARCYGLRLPAATEMH